jgi:Bacterial regulatory proteins, luxR family
VADVAEGIAQALFVTTKTVEVHLSSCYRKLGITFAAISPRASAKPGLACALPDQKQSTARRDWLWRTWRD